MSSTREEALTLPVSDLHAATTFYLSALQPLDYCRISTGSHKTYWGSSQTVGIGPAGTSRIDIFLSQSDRRHRPESLSSTQVVFPALSRFAVRDAYAAALNAGGSSVSAPQYDQLQHAPAIFAAVVTDLDRNRLRIEFDESTSLASVRNHSISAGATPKLSANSDQASAKYLKEADSTACQRLGEASSNRDIVKKLEGTSSHGEEAATTQSSGRPPGRGVVGALIGAAAGAALAYSMVASQRDSKERERDFASRMSVRERVRTEPGEFSSQSQAQSRHPVSRRRSSEVRRDSGYWSINDRGKSSIYDQNGHFYDEARSSPRRSASVSARSQKFIEWETSPSSKHSNPRSRRNSINSFSNMDSIPRSRLQTSSKAAFFLAPPSSTSRWKNLFRPPAPPEMPSAPWEPHPASSSDRRGRSTATAGTHFSVVSRSKGTPSTSRTAKEAGLGTANSVASRESNKTAIRTALPPSTVASSQRFPRTAGKAGRTAPSSSGVTRLTASSLAAHNIPLPESSVGSGGIIDDLETVMPDDSISSVGIANKAKRSTSWHSRR